MWRWLFLLLMVLAVALQMKLRYGQGGHQDVANLQARVAKQRAENQGLKSRNQELAADVKDLQSGGQAIEERARLELGMIKPGEVFYQVIDADPNAPPESVTPSDHAP
ncbi:cell division protein FtsB [Ahniella affigens]|uniref:Cell division protein FtsB n=1 Tax=Ahniella affigens TaxID=2021234 RepID=A0A2P1PW76_9GAMM|nr:cell division protein FtsB [Ahniella affigens]AVP99034.1 cell division protein FtsB [Ahniella affigens]